MSLCGAACTDKRRRMTKLEMKAPHNETIQGLYGILIKELPGFDKYMIIPVRDEPSKARELQVAAAQQALEESNRQCLTCCSSSTTATRRMLLKRGHCQYVAVIIMEGLRAQVSCYEWLLQTSVRVDITGW